MLRHALLFALCLFSVHFSTAEVIETKTKVSFPETITYEEHKLQCTGVTYRSKYLIKIYAIAHYGDPADAPEGDAIAKLDAWVKAKSWKAILISFVFDVDESKMREAVEGALKEARYDKPEGKAFIDAFSHNYPLGTKVQLIASVDGVLRILMNDKVTGEYKDQELIDALWFSWLGPNSVVSDRERLVLRDVK